MVTHTTNDEGAKIASFRRSGFAIYRSAEVVLLCLRMCRRESCERTGGTVGRGELAALAWLFALKRVRQPDAVAAPKSIIASAISASFASARCCRCSRRIIAEFSHKTSPVPLRKMFCTARHYDLDCCGFAVRAHLGFEPEKNIAVLCQLSTKLASATAKDNFVDSY